MSEKSIFSYSENMQLVIEQNEERDINYLRSFIRARRLSDTDAAILYAVALAGYSNRRNIERFLSLQTKYQVQPKKSYLYNINRLVDNGFLVRSYASYGNSLETPRIYCLSVAVCALLPHLFGQKKTMFRPGLPFPHPCDVLSNEIGFQTYITMLSDPVFQNTDLTLRQKVVLSSHTCVPAVLSHGSKGDCYVFVLRRQEAYVDRALFDAQALIAKMAADGTRGALLFVCEDVVHMETVSARLPQALLSSGAVLFTYDLSLSENDRVVTYLATPGIGTVSLVRTELEPLSGR
ncbi:MAG: hypothetical protein IJL03_07070 [Lachnospiraceae bacterium]|nr:hypothetical protein [Lachnospiraceae bacterium]